MIPVCGRRPIRLPAEDKSAIAAQRLYDVVLLDPNGHDKILLSLVHFVVSEPPAALHVLEAPHQMFIPESVLVGGSPGVCLRRLHVTYTIIIPLFARCLPPSGF